MIGSIISLSEASAKPTQRSFKYVLVTGGRDFKGDTALEAAMKSVVERWGDVIFINGGQKGADTMCSVFALHNRLPCYIYPAEWHKYPRGKGNPAGPIRNRLMLDMHPDISVVLAFHDFLPHSTGTYDMCSQALKRGIPVLHYTDDGLFQIYHKLDDLPPQQKKEG